MFLECSSYRLRTWEHKYSIIYNIKKTCIVLPKKKDLTKTKNEVFVKALYEIKI